MRFVKEGGYVFTVVDTGVLSNSEDEYVRRFLYRTLRIHAIVEFPHNAFKAAGTGVKTAVILCQKMKNPPEDYEIFGSLPQNLGYILNKQDPPLIQITTIWVKFFATVETILAWAGCAKLVEMMLIWKNAVIGIKKNIALFGGRKLKKQICKGVENEDSI